jgi:hypothetical protein
MAGKQKFTNEAIITALKKRKGLIYLAAETLGCAPLTIYRRVELSQEVAQCLKDQRGKIVDTAENKLFISVNKREPWAVAMVLKTLGKDRGYVERIEMSNVTEEQLAAWADAIAAKLVGAPSGSTAQMDEDSAATDSVAEAGG